jgi:hypothetical protein
VQGHELIKTQTRLGGDGAGFRRAEFMAKTAQVEDQNFIAGAIHAQDRTIIERMGHGVGLRDCCRFTASYIKKEKIRRHAGRNSSDGRRLRPNIPGPARDFWEIGIWTSNRV